MHVLTGGLVVFGAILAAVALIHAYAQWTIRGIDQDNAVREPTASAGGSGPGEGSAL